jgi:hypothetical protein
MLTPPSVWSASDRRPAAPMHDVLVREVVAGSARPTALELGEAGRVLGLHDLDRGHLLERHGQADLHLHGVAGRELDRRPERGESDLVDPETAASRGDPGDPEPARGIGHRAQASRRDQDLGTGDRLLGRIRDHRAHEDRRRGRLGQGGAPDGSEARQEREHRRTQPQQLARDRGEAGDPGAGHGGSPEGGRGIRQMAPGPAGRYAGPPGRFPGVASFVTFRDPDLGWPSRGPIRIRSSFSCPRSHVSLPPRLDDRAGRPRADAAPLAGAGRAADPYGQEGRHPVGHRPAIPRRPVQVAGDLSTQHGDHRRP